MCVLTVPLHEGTYVANAYSWRSNARVTQTRMFCRTTRHTGTTEDLAWGLWVLRGNRRIFHEEYRSYELLPFSSIEESEITSALWAILGSNQ